MSGAGSESNKRNGIHLLSRRDISSDPLPDPVNLEKACVLQQLGTGMEQPGCSWEPQEIFLHPKASLVSK